MTELTPEVFGYVVTLDGKSYVVEDWSREKDRLTLILRMDD